MKPRLLGLRVIPLVLLCSGCTHIHETLSGFVHRSDLSSSTSNGATSEGSSAVTSQQRQVEKIMAQAHQQMADAIAAKWGYEEVLTPSRNVWVQYDNQMKTRTVMDFENGELRIDHLMTSGDSSEEAHQMIESAVLQARDETIADLDKLDMEIQLARQIAQQRGMVVTEDPMPSDDASMRVLHGLIDREAMMGFDKQHVKMLPMMSGDKKNRTPHKMQYRLRFKPGYQAVLARRYLEPVLEHAQNEGISPSLIYAIMQTESAFNPRAVSPAPAYGLMQLVPTSGGLDAYQYVFGTKRIVRPEFLFHAGNNIRLGTAYLKILDSRYLKAISDPLSRLYCVIAAYNTGAGNVARTFTGKTNINAAASVINKLAPDQVLEQLKTRLPFVETQRYIVKVLSARKNYSVWDTSTLSQAENDRDQMRISGG